MRLSVFHFGHGVLFLIRFEMRWTLICIVLFTLRIGVRASRRRLKMSVLLKT